MEMDHVTRRIEITCLYGWLRRIEIMCLYEKMEMDHCSHRWRWIMCLYGWWRSSSYHWDAGDSKCRIIHSPSVHSDIAVFLLWHRFFSHWHAGVPECRIIHSQSVHIDFAFCKNPNPGSSVRGSGSSVRGSADPLARVRRGSLARVAPWEARVAPWEALRTPWHEREMNGRERERESPSLVCPTAQDSLWRWN